MRRIVMKKLITAAVILCMGMALLAPAGAKLY
jgi:hypothetical protein